MEPATIALIIGLATLMVERIFVWASKIKKSDCLGMKIERSNEMNTPK